jgi:hypothetical protein
MRSRPLLILAALSAFAITTTVLAATPATAGGKKYRSHPVHGVHPGKAKGHWKNRGVYDVRYVVVHEPRHVVVRPVAYDDFCWQRPRFMVVRPVPVWVAPYSHDGLAARIGIHNGQVSFDLAFASRSPAYGCGFCSANFSRYSAWESHVHGCNHGPEGPIVCERWTHDDLAYYRAQARERWNDEYYENWDG